MGRDGQWTIGTLTKRQMEVLDLLADGMSTADIATKLWVSKATVRNHVQQNSGELGVHTRLGLPTPARSRVPKDSWINQL